MKTIGAAMFAVVVLLAATSSAQWLDYPAKNVPRTKDGTPILTRISDNVVELKLDVFRPLP
jgi:hypothetical protein